MTRFTLILSTLLLPLLSACALLGGGSAPEVPRAKGYEVAVPQSWTAQSSKGESDSAYQNKKGSIITLNSTCSYDSKFSVDVLTKQLLLGARKIKYKEKKKILVDGKEGQYSNVQASLDNKPFNLLIFILPKNDCVFDFTLVSTKNIELEEQEEFNSFFKSFKYGTN